MKRERERERDLLALPACFGGLGLVNQPEEFGNSWCHTAPLTAPIMQQSTDLGGASDEQLVTKLGNIH